MEFIEEDIIEDGFMGVLFIGSCLSPRGKVSKNLTMYADHNFRSRGPILQSRAAAQSVAIVSNNYKLLIVYF